jgi:putative DNA primase/helicase
MAPKLPQTSTPTLSRLSDVPVREIQWLWPLRIPFGHVTLLAGDGGTGKSLLTVDLAARVTKGLPWPDDSGKARKGEVVLLNAEDDPSAVVAPRVVAAGGDPQAIHCLNEPASVSPVALRNNLKQLPKVRLVVIDPIGAFFAKELRTESSARALLNGFAEVAAEFSAAIVLVAHLNKSGSRRASTRVAGSQALINGVRMAQLVAPLPADPSQRALLQLKGNLAPDPGAMAYRIETADGKAGFVHWTRRGLDLSADEVLNPRTGNGSRERASEQSAAAEFLSTELADGPLPTATIRARATAAGHSWGTVRRASDSLGIIKRRIPDSGVNGWEWALPKANAGDDEQPDNVRKLLKLRNDSDIAAETESERPAKGRPKKRKVLPVKTQAQSTRRNPVPHMPRQEVDADDVDEHEDDPIKAVEDSDSSGDEEREEAQFWLDPDDGDADGDEEEDDDEEADEEDGDDEDAFGWLTDDEVGDE